MIIFVNENICKMKRLLLLLIICVSALPLVARQGYYELIDSAECCIKEKNWEKAEHFLRTVLVSYPDDNNNSLILSNLATVQRYQGKLAEAVKNYTYAINMTPNAVTLIKNRASLYLDMDSVNDALEDYERVLLIDETDEESRYYHGILSLRIDDMNAAKKDFDHILFYNPASGLGREGLGLWFMKRHNYREAVKYFTEILKQRPSSLLLSKRAECYLAMKKLNDAGDDIRKAIELSPDDGYLYVLRAKLNKLRYNAEDVERDIRLAEQCGISRELAEQILNSEK